MKNKIITEEMIKNIMIKNIDKNRLASNIIAVTDENDCTNFYYTGCISLEFYLDVMADIENEGLVFAKEFFRPFSTGRKRMNMYKDVVTFIEACDQKPTVDSVNLYTRLIEEEYNEFLVAKHQEDEVEQLDACMDMIWVILGYCYAKGYDVKGAWGEVAKSNLSKIDSETGKVKKRHDGKVLKPEGWQPPNLTPFIVT